MATEKQSTTPKTPAQVRRPYQKPGFRSEQVFETAAVRCGKTHPRYAQCKRAKKTS